jgi:hypothetical protein
MIFKQYSTFLKRYLLQERREGLAIILPYHRGRRKVDRSPKAAKGFFKKPLATPYRGRCVFFHAAFDKGVAQSH